MPFVTSKAQGTGLGLSFVKQVMNDHHGRIELAAEENSDLPKKAGVSFDLEIPVVTS